MTGLALKFNEVTFRTVLSRPCPIERYSDAVLFDHLLNESTRALNHMLSWARSLATPALITELANLYPENTHLKEVSPMTSEGFEADIRYYGLPEAYAVVYSGNFTQLRNAIRLMSAHPDFKTLTSKEFLPSVRDRMLPDYIDADESDYESVTELKRLIRRCEPPLYNQSSQEKFMAWEPELWSMPDRKGIKHVTEFIPKFRSLLRYHGSIDHWRNGSYFSATAATVQFLKRLSLDVRMQFRRIVL